ncbi:MAG: DNA primase, partial [Methanocorpusculum sp.]|nr:DNA primase [Methanocorpusculum sp.]
ALETIERIGPCVSRISVEGIEDLRAIKRRKIVDRAKELLMESFDEVGLSTNEILAEVREASRVVKITAIGDERLPAGPTVLESDAIIILEGRADVLNLLRCGIKNTVAVEGTKVPEIVAELSRKKNTTVFVDGDRGGDLILKELLQVADVDFVAFSPRGRSVEDMTRKEIIKSLRNKVPADVVRAQVAKNEPLSDLVFEITAPEDEGDPAAQSEPVIPEAVEEKPEPKEPISSVEGHAEYMKGTGRARVLNSDAVILGDYTIKELEDILPRLDDDAAGIIVDSSVGQKFVDAAYKKGIKYIAAREFTGIVHRPAGIRLIPL